eukprot:TRINITY_DN1169_c0_g1_i2.p1 TRINITY_DN1169_c0_g1~~TRINITY_DN1169_c0_g1_i2.p1  ORF type:complete len:343 (+),score=33.29 TRINITY_DN1169_c0_g1_i2:367-1395(+)
MLCVAKAGQTCSASYPASGVCQCPEGQTCSKNGAKCKPPAQAPQPNDCSRSCTPKHVLDSGGCKSGQTCSASFPHTGVCRCGADQTCSKDGKTCMQNKEPEARDCTTTCSPSLTDWAKGCNAKAGQTCSAFYPASGVCQCPDGQTCSKNGAQCKSPAQAPQPNDCTTTCKPKHAFDSGGCPFGQSCSASFPHKGVCRCPTGQFCSQNGKKCSAPVDASKSEHCTTTCSPSMFSPTGGCKFGQLCSAMWPAQGHCYCPVAGDVCTADGCTHPDATRLYEDSGLVGGQGGKLFNLPSMLVLAVGGLGVAGMVSLAVLKCQRQQGAASRMLLAASPDIEMEPTTE